jgi:hypothetical protein
LEACAASDTRLVFVGNWSASAYGQKLRSDFAGAQNLVLCDPVYDMRKLAHLRKHAGFYIHGHSIGGTNPSLVEAIFHHDRILAFDCIFNRSTLRGAGSYFGGAEELTALISESQTGVIGAADMAILRDEYVWSSICAQYLKAFRVTQNPSC